MLEYVLLIYEGILTVIHIQALACGGADSPENMQWQSVAEDKAKDKWERKDCQTPSARESDNGGNSGGYQSGSRGGCFTVDANGNKKYVAHSFCGR